MEKTYRKISNSDIEKMKQLKLKGETYDDIALKMKCSPWTIKYHLIPNRKANSIRYQTKQKSNPILAKKKSFLRFGKDTFSIKELLDKIELNPFCFYTGEKIDLSKPTTYTFDHIIPRSKNGNNSLENLALTKIEINQAKYNLNKTEFIQLCKRVYNFYLQGLEKAEDFSI